MSEQVNRGLLIALLMAPVLAVLASPSEAQRPPPVVLNRAPVAAPPPNRAITVEEAQRLRADAYARPAMLTCVGPLRVAVSAANANQHAQGYDFQVQFAAAASAADIRPGQCWRAGGWANTALMDPDGQGEIVYRSLLGPCPLIRSMRTENGAVAEYISNDRIVGQALLNASRPGRVTVEARYLGRDTSSGVPRGPSRYEGVVAAGAMWRAGQCQ